jgi:hypothetical protein
MKATIGFADFEEVLVLVGVRVDDRVFVDVCVGDREAVGVLVTVNDTVGASKFTRMELIGVRR